MTPERTFTPAREHQEPDRVGLHHDLLVGDVERSARRRLSPRRNRWAEVVEFDRKVEEIDQREAEISAQVEALKEQITEAEKADRARLAAYAVKPKGKRPMPTAPELIEERDRLLAERDALGVARHDVLEAKERFVERHRGRLTKDAADATARALARYQELIDQAEQARAELVALRADEIWAQLYPDDLLTSDPGFASLKGGRRYQALPELTAIVSANRVFELLREDGDWLRTGATPEQSARLDGRDVRLKPRTGWVDVDMALRQQLSEEAAQARRGRADPRPRWGE